MYISEIRIENFRLFGEGKDALILPLRPGLTALVGENDSGKTAIVDALRLILGTRDQEYLRLESTDFHYAPTTGKRADRIVVGCTFSGLSKQDRGAFSEYLTHPKEGVGGDVALHITWIAKRSEKVSSSRRYQPPEWRSGVNGNGPVIDPTARSLLMATYLRPLRDAERAMSAGRGSRLSQILLHTKEIKDSGIPFSVPKDGEPFDPSPLSVLGLGDYANHLLKKSASIAGVREKLNREYLEQLSFSEDVLDAQISVSGSSEETMRLRQLLEKLDVSLAADNAIDEGFGRGLGSNNLLFMACELLLLATEDEGFPILLIEEPEAHLHPQRQLRLMTFLQEHSKALSGERAIQILVTTHSPNLASHISLDNVVLLHGGKPFPMARGMTKLSASDYRFLERFLDVTKANLFFARGVTIVEGDAENILLPTLARLIGRDFSKHGVSVVNVGTVGLRRYANIFLRSAPAISGEIAIPVSCITDLDVMPDCAPTIVGRIGPGGTIPLKADRRWRVKSDFPAAPAEQTLAAHRIKIETKAQGQHVKTFVADEWTLEFDLAFAGLAEEVWSAIHLASHDDRIQSAMATVEAEVAVAQASFAQLKAEGHAIDVLASRIYAPLVKTSLSKPVVAQYLAEILERQFEAKLLTAPALEAKLPPYLVAAIKYVAPLKADVEVVEAEVAQGAAKAVEDQVA